MAITFLGAVNDVMVRCRFIQGDTGRLATDTTSTATGAVATSPWVNSAHQSEIDITAQIWNEVITDVFSRGSLSPEVASATVSLVVAQREYTLPSDFEQFSGNYKVLRAATKQWTISEYPGGYEKMLVDQVGLASSWRGTPQYYALSPVNTQTIRMDFEPVATETYNVLYDKRVHRSATSATTATESMPFNDTVTETLVPVVAESVNLVFKGKSYQDIIRNGVSLALEKVTQTQRKSSYGPQQIR